MTLLPLLALGFALPSGPVTTVPWNGHTGAASFTYDDARSSQIPNLLPQLDALGLKATFFIAVTGTGGDFEARKSAWIQAAKNGHELANHTKNHVNVPADPNAASVISEMATYLRGLDPVVEAVTFAYPNCNVNGKTGVGSENFVARGCGQTTYSWGSQPSDWMNVQGLILTPTSVSTAISMLGTAKSNNAWVTTIVHDVKDNPDSYSLTPADNKKMLDAAVSNKLWIATFEDVAAYYRAHFAMDAATATKNGTTWNVQWSSPHPKMPRSVKLRVKLAAATFGTDFVVKQGATVVPPESDGSYVVEFMKLAMTVEPRTVGVHPAAARAVPEVHGIWTENGIQFRGIDRPMSAKVLDVRGTTLFQGALSDGLLPIPGAGARGILLVTLVDPASGATVRTLVNATR